MTELQRRTSYEIHEVSSLDLFLFLAILFLSFLSRSIPFVLSPSFYLSSSIPSLLSFRFFVVPFFCLSIHPSLSFPSCFPLPPTLLSPSRSFFPSLPFSLVLVPSFASPFSLVLVPSFLPSLPFSLVLVPSFASPFSLVLSRFLLIAFPSLFSSLFLGCSTHEKQNIFISQGLPSSATLHSQTRQLPS